jgi:hypothetical protein
MRYHWGLAVGHLYTHGQTTNRATTPTVPNDCTRTTHERSDIAVVQHINGEDDQPDLEHGGAAVDDWEDIDHLDECDGQAVDIFNDDGVNDDDFSDDDMAVAIYNMYGE